MDSSHVPSWYPIAAMQGPKGPSSASCVHDTWQLRTRTDGGDYRRCRGCGLEEQISLDSLETRFAGAQDEWYGARDPACLTPFALALSAEDAKYRISIVRDASPAGRLLEIGPGAGQFAVAGIAAGYDVVAIEDSEVLAEEARKRGVAVLEGTFESLDIEMESFDVVVSWHVIEHVLDPHAFLSHATRVAAPGATLIIGTPNASSLEHRIAGRKSPNYCRPHLRLFTPTSLEDVLRESGWDPVRTFTTDQPENWVRFLAAFARGVLDRRGARTAQENDPPPLSVQSIDAGRGMAAIRVAGTLSWILRTLQNRFNRGNEVIVIGRRRP